MEFNDYAYCLVKSAACESIASKLAPTIIRTFCQDR